MVRATVWLNCFVQLNDRLIAMVRHPFPKSSVFVATDPISAKATALFDELTRVSNIRYIFVAHGLDSHAKYRKQRKLGLFQQLLSGDFGVLRRLGDLLASRFAHNLGLVPEVSESLKTQMGGGGKIDLARRYSILDMSLLSGAKIISMNLSKVSSGRFVVDPATLAYFTKCDFGVLLSFNLILSGAILDKKWGIWSFHPADTFRYRGRPSCFWEFIDGAPFGITLQRLTEEVDAGPVLAQRHLAVPRGRARSLEQVRQGLEMLQLGMVSEALVTVQRLGGTHLPSPNLSTSRYHRERDADRLLPSLLYLLEVIRNYARL